MKSSALAAILFVGLILALCWWVYWPTESLCGRVCEPNRGFLSKSMGWGGGQGSSYKPPQCHCKDGSSHVVGPFRRFELLVGPYIDREIDSRRDATRRASQRFQQLHRDDPDE